MEFDPFEGLTPEQAARAKKAAEEALTWTPAPEAMSHAERALKELGNKIESVDNLVFVIPAFAQFAENLRNEQCSADTKSVADKIFAGPDGAKKVG